MSFPNVDIPRCWSCGNAAVPNTICQNCGKLSTPAGRGVFDPSKLMNYAAQRVEQNQPVMNNTTPVHPQHGVVWTDTSPGAYVNNFTTDPRFHSPNAPSRMQEPQHPQQVQQQQQQLHPPQMQQQQQQSHGQYPPQMEQVMKQAPQQYGQQPLSPGEQMLDNLYERHGYSRRHRYKRQQSPPTVRRQCVTCEYMKDARSRYSQCHGCAEAGVPLPPGVSKFYPQQSMPQQSVPQQTMPQQPMPQQTLPQQSMPQQSMPQQPLPQQSMPQQYLQQQQFSSDVNVQQHFMPQQPPQQQQQGGTPARPVHTGDLHSPDCARDPGSADTKSSIPPTQRSARSQSPPLSTGASSAVAGSFGDTTPGKRSDRSISPTQPMGTKIASSPFDGHFKAADGTTFPNAPIKKEPFDVSNQKSPASTFGGTGGNPACSLNEIRMSTFQLISHGGYEYNKVKLHVPKVTNGTAFEQQMDWVLNSAWDFSVVPFYAHINQIPLNQATSLTWLDGYIQSYSAHLAKCEQLAIAAMAHRSAISATFVELQALRTKVATKLGEESFDPDRVIKFLEEKLPHCVGQVRQKLEDTISTIQQIRASTLPPTPQTQHTQTHLSPTPEEGAIDESPIAKPSPTEVPINSDSSLMDITGDIDERFCEDSEDVYKKRDYIDKNDRENMLRAFSSAGDEETPVLQNLTGSSVVAGNQNSAEMEGVRDETPVYEQSKDDKKGRKKMRDKQIEEEKQSKRNHNVRQ